MAFKIKNKKKTEDVKDPIIPISNKTLNELNAEFHKLFKDIMPEDESKKSDFEAWQDARKEMLSGMSDDERALIEAKIKLAIVKILKKRKGEFFTYEDYLEIDLLKKYFNIIVTTGDRNIGKTYSSHEEMRKVVNKGRRFIKLRNIKEEVEQAVKSDRETYLDPLGWSYESKSNPDIYNLHEELVGWYRDVNTIGKFKSIEFPKTDLLVWEEFNSRVACKDKFAKFVEFIVTVQRHNPSMMAIMQANYVSQGDEVLQKLGVGLKKMSKEDFIEFDWISGTILIFIPKGIYKSTGDKKNNLGYRLALKDQSLYQSQYGGGFQDEVPVNIVNSQDIHSLEPLFNIYYNKSATTDYQAYKMTMYWAYSKNINDGKGFNYLTTTIGNNDKPIIVFDTYNSVKYPHSTLLDVDTLDMVLAYWNSGKVMTDSIETHKAIVQLLTIAKQKLERDDSMFDVIEEIR